MKSGVFRTLIAAALLFLVPLAAAGHEAHREGAAKAGVSQHSHGPHVPCPPASPVVCVACAAAGLFDAPPTAIRLPVPQVSRDGAPEAVRTVSRRVAACPTGRSPPAS